MAYAPHTNSDVNNGADLPLLLGSFRGADFGAYFEYAVRPADGIEFAPDLPHIVYTIDGYRYAKVLKTVAWVAAHVQGQDDPVLQKWAIKEHRVYDTTWVNPERFRA